MTAPGREPFKDLLAIQDRMNRLFEAAFSEPKMGEDPAGVGAWSPVSDLLETPQSLVLLCEIPGISEKEIDVRVDEGVLTISGERRMDTEGAGGRFHRVERSYGRFSRRFVLPTAVSADGVSAAYRDGVLSVTLPKKAEGSPRRVNIQNG
jgi:HSP20 family protein